MVPIVKVLYMNIREIAKAYYKTDEAGITWTATVGSVTCGVAIIPATVFIDTARLRTTVITATSVMVKVLNFWLALEISH